METENSFETTLKLNIFPKASKEAVNIFFLELLERTVFSWALTTCSECPHRNQQKLIISSHWNQEQRIQDKNTPARLEPDVLNLWSRKRPWRVCDTKKFIFFNSLAEKKYITNSLLSSCQWYWNFVVCWQPACTSLLYYLHHKLIFKLQCSNSAVKWLESLTVNPQAWAQSRQLCVDGVLVLVCAHLNIQTLPDIVSLPTIYKCHCVAIKEKSDSIFIVTQY